MLSERNQLSQELAFVTRFTEDDELSIFSQALDLGLDLLFRQTAEQAYIDINYRVTMLSTSWAMSALTIWTMLVRLCPTTLLAVGNHDNCYVRQWTIDPLAPDWTMDRLSNVFGSAHDHTIFALMAWHSCEARNPL